MKPFAIALLVCFVSIQSGALAQERKIEDPTTTGNALLEALNGKSEFLRGVAWGYIFGVHRIINDMVTKLVPGGLLNSCAPESPMGSWLTSLSTILKTTLKPATNCHSC
jgi:hypothetical protein